ncbi:MAG: 2-amino-4-hydroxy-6-hydroxymethyldihydropteridine diphosphokinase [bacterium]|nr:2-amino-4-hydroxy-6-hydroxymethyldihydropteridine diphosphokinase [bacterium]
MASVYLGIGSNLGDRLTNIKLAIKKLSQMGEIIKMSSIWETEPWFAESCGGEKNQPLFLNCVVLVKTKLSPYKLLNKLSQIETELKRKRTKRFGPRTIDLDILFYDSLIINDPNLIIPHPHIQQRKFVLLPLSEIVPDLIHPILKKTVKELLEDLPNSEQACKLSLPPDKVLK